MARGNFGERLKRERELREVTLEEITSATRIGPRFLEALENEDWEKLPGGVFNRGFVRSVARYLGLDEESILAEYDLAHEPIDLHLEYEIEHIFQMDSFVAFLSHSPFSRVDCLPRVIRLALLLGTAPEAIYCFPAPRLHPDLSQIPSACSAPPVAGPATSLS
jgi:transcriptional regulator with XRE-family HTH domain